MSYDIDLNDPVTGKRIVFNFKHDLKGGTYRMGGNDEAWLNITWNYGIFYKAFGEKGIREIYGKTGAESIPMIDAVVAKLGDDVSDDYWDATEGNAKAALLKLRALAQLRPDGIWDGD